MQTITKDDKLYTFFSELQLNKNNPRSISKLAFERLKKSIKEFPEMLEKRPIVYDESKIVLGGNMRLRALQELVKDGFKLKENYFLLAEGWSEEKKDEFIIRDNIADGDWDYDMLANEWDKEQLEEWGVPVGWEDKKELSEDYSQNIGEVIYEPKNTNHTVEDLFVPEHKFDEEIDKLSNEELKELLRARVSYFSTFDYPKIADYYAYQATPEEKRIFEKLALVLLDKNQLIENGFSKLVNSVTEDEKD